jgi:gamma-glutamylcyclotransferase (GGCT)/AIG2-like uncharacterized protein YtfP
MAQYLFVCGTLLPGLIPDELWQVAARFRDVGPASVAGCLYDLGDYPGAVLDECGTSRVMGRLYQLPDDDETLPALDEYEGYRPDGPEGSLFVRVQTSASPGNGDSVSCWIYVYNRDVAGAPVIADGDYLASLRRASLPDQIGRKG